MKNEKSILSNFLEDSKLQVPSRFPNYFLECCILVFEVHLMSEMYVLYYIIVIRIHVLGNGGKNNSNYFLRFFIGPIPVHRYVRW